MKPVAIDHRVALGFNQTHMLHADALQFRGQRIRLPDGNHRCSGKVEMDGMRNSALSSSTKRG